MQPGKTDRRCAQRRRCSSKRWKSIFKLYKKIIPKQQNQRNKTPLMKRINSSRHAVPIVVEGTLCTTRSTFCATGSVSPTTGLLLGETGGDIPPPPPPPPTHPFHLCPARYSVSQSSAAQAENAGIVPTMIQSVAKGEGGGGGGGAWNGGGWGGGDNVRTDIW